MTIGKSKSHFRIPYKYVKHLLPLLTISLLLSYLGCRSQSPQTHPYLILYAFDAEGETLAGQMTERRSEKQVGRNVVIGPLSGKSVVLAESGIGMTNAALVTQHMIDLYHPQCVIMTGIAGSLDSLVHIGDIVACGEWIQHDYGYIGKDGFESHKLKVYHPVEDSVVQVSTFPVDTVLLSAAYLLKDNEFLLEKIGSREPRLIVGGVGVSGNSFIDSREKREWLAETFAATIVDMESAAVAQVCTVNDIPFIIFRSASDLAGGSGTETATRELDEFFKTAADNSAEIVTGFLQQL